MTLYGLTGRFAAEAAEVPALDAARILSQGKDLYRVACAAGERIAEVSGKFRFAAQTPADFPAVGDFVLLAQETEGNAVIRRVLPRKSAFVRKAAGNSSAEQVVAANIDTVFICMSLNNDFNLRRLERYLTIGWNSGALPVVVLTKADLCADAAARLREAQAVSAGAEVLLTTALETDGYAQILPYIRARETVAFIGSSGVGKSTLINRLLGAQALQTNGLRNDDRGRHTTTRRELLLLANGGMVIDTPGMRELGMTDADPGKTFADIEALFSGCRFPDCTHTREPGCAVRAALQSGALEEARWNAYCKLRQEAEYARDREGYLTAKEDKFKRIAQINKAGRRAD